MVKSAVTLRALDTFFSTTGNPSESSGGSLRKHPFLVDPRETSLAAKSEEKQMFWQAICVEAKEGLFLLTDVKGFKQNSRCPFYRSVR